MPLVEAWYDPHKKKYFRKKSDYLAHLRVVGRARMEKRQLAARSADEDILIMAMRLSALSSRQIENFVKDNYAMLVARALRLGHTFFEETKTKQELLTFSITLNGLRSVACTHSAPIGEKTCWSSRDNPDRPTHFPGYCGRVDITHKGRFDSSMLRGIAVHSGSGGGGGGKLSYELVLWEADFPQLIG